MGGWMAQIILDQPSIVRLDAVYPPLKAKAILIYQQIFDKYGLMMRCSRGYSTFQEQDALYSQSRTAPGPRVTNAKGGQSTHNYAIAFDSCFRGVDPYLAKHPNGENIWRDVALFGQQLGLMSGVNFPELGDTDHLENRYKMNIAQLRQLYDQGGLEAVWKACDVST